MDSGDVDINQDPAIEMAEDSEGLRNRIRNQTAMTAKDREDFQNRIQRLYGDRLTPGELYRRITEHYKQPIHAPFRELRAKKILETDRLFAVSDDEITSPLAETEFTATAESAHIVGKSSLSQVRASNRPSIRIYDAEWSVNDKGEKTFYKYGKPKLSPEISDEVIKKSELLIAERRNFLNKDHQYGGPAAHAALKEVENERASWALKNVKVGASELPIFPSHEDVLTNNGIAKEGIKTFLKKQSDPLYKAVHSEAVRLEHFKGFSDTIFNAMMKAILVNRAANYDVRFKTAVKKPQRDDAEHSPANANLPDIEMVVEVKKRQLLGIGKWEKLPATTAQAILKYAFQSAIEAEKEGFNQDTYAVDQKYAEFKGISFEDVRRMDEAKGLQHEIELDYEPNIHQVIPINQSHAEKEKAKYRVSLSGKTLMDYALCADTKLASHGQMFAHSFSNALESELSKKQSRHTR